MKIVNPSVKLLDTTNSIANIAYAARVCYATQDKEHKLSDLDFINKVLISRGHISMLRHGTSYIKVPYNKFMESKELMKLWNNKFVTEKWKTNEHVYMIANHNCIYDCDLWDKIGNEEWKKEYEIDGIFLSDINPRNCERFSFEVVTQISTSRELNRVSPNNISEQSTRYVEVGTICRPHWLKYDKDEFDSGEELEDDNATAHYLLACDYLFNKYFYLKNIGLAQQDARGVLPLDTMTRCIYTYSVKEWKQILNLRYFEKTGKAHPNAKIIASMIYDELCQLGYKDYLDAE